jgi:S1-C subfamily serine protease
MKFLSIRILITLLLLSYVANAQENYDLSTFLMKSTFKIEGQESMGTCFIIGEPLKEDPNKARFVLVTANHVLQKAKGDKVILHLRKKTGDMFSRVKYPITIRHDTKEMWIKHPEVDIGAMYVQLPKDIDIALLPTSFLADDDILGKYEVRPGDTVFALGFPLGQESNSAGFPILRMGTISIYAIIPTKTNKTFLFDFEVFQGNSGGPVFLVQENRIYGGGTHPGIVRLILGLVSEQRKLDIHVLTPSEASIREYPLKLGVVIHASFIKEIIELLSKSQTVEKKWACQLC